MKYFIQTMEQKYHVLRVVLWPSTLGPIHYSLPGMVPWAYLGITCCVVWGSTLVLKQEQVPKRMSFTLSQHTCPLHFISAVGQPQLCFLSPSGPEVQPYRTSSQGICCPQNRRCGRCHISVNKTYP